MAKFTSTAPLNIRIAGLYEAVGPAGTVHRIPDALSTEFERDYAPGIPGFAWTDEDEAVVLPIGQTDVTGLTASLDAKYDKTGGAVSGAVSATGAITATRIGGVIYADRYSSIQAAIDAAPASAVIHVPAGTYTISASLTLPPAVTLRGDGRATLISTTADVAIITVASTVSGVTIRDLRISGSGNTAHTSGRGVLISGADNARLSGLWVDSCDKGIFVNTGTRVEITNCRVTSDRSTLGAIDIAGLTTGSVSGCLVESPATHGIDVRETSVGVTVTANECITAGNTAFVVSAGCRDCSLVGNISRTAVFGVIVENSATNTLVSGNILSGATSNGVLVSNSTGDATQTTVTGNIVTGSGGHGIFVNACSRASITGNAVYAAGLDGIRVTGAAASGAIIAGNTIQGSTSTAGRALYVTSSAMGCTITGNNLRDNAGIGLIVDALRCSIVGNIVVDSDSGNVLAVGGLTVTGNGSYSTVVGNISVASAGTTKQDYGIVVQAGATSVVVADNVVYQNQTAGLANSGTGTVLSSNVGYVSRSSGVASVANAGTITHGLATTPTKYGLTGTAAKRIAAVTAVSSTTLTVALHDDTGAAVTAAENVAWWAEV